MRSFVELFSHTIFFLLVNIILTILPVLLSVALMTLLERKILAAVQRRRGPNIVGVFGLLQPFADALKLLTKEFNIPGRSFNNLVIMSPMLSLLLAISCFSFLPFGYSSFFYGTNAFTTLYIMAISSINVYTIIMAGWASKSVYAFLGSLRASAQFISYEASLTLNIMAVFLVTGSFDLSEIAHIQEETTCNLIVLFPIFITYLVGIISETNRTPFDLAEAESELVAGYGVEFSAVGFTFFFLAEYCSITLYCLLTIVLFFGADIHLHLFNLIEYFFASFFRIIKFFIYFVFEFFLNINLELLYYDRYWAADLRVFVPRKAQGTLTETLMERLVRDEYNFSHQLGYNNVYYISFFFFLLEKYENFFLYFLNDFWTFWDVKKRILFLKFYNFGFFLFSTSEKILGSSFCYYLTPGGKIFTGISLDEDFNYYYYSRSIFWRSNIGFLSPLYMTSKSYSFIIWIIPILCLIITLCVLHVMFWDKVKHLYKKYFSKRVKRVFTLKRDIRKDTLRYRFFCYIIDCLWDRFFYYFPPKPPRSKESRIERFFIEELRILSYSQLNVIKKLLILFLFTLDFYFFFYHFAIHPYFGATFLNVLIIGIEMTLMLSFFCYVRATYARYRFDQLMKLNWKNLLLLSLALDIFLACLLIC